MNRTRKVYDWRHRGWGNDYIFRPRERGQFAHLDGWRSDLCVGDVLVLYGSEGQRAAYIIDSIKYESDPPDMFSAEVHYEHGLVDDSLSLSREPKTRVT